MSGWLLRLEPEADELQQIAARAHHLRRWTVPRSSYPEGRAGYLRWRRDLKARHAEEVGAILAGEGFSGDEIATVQGIVRKEGLGSDPRVQVHEDALCLVFMEQQLADVAERLGDDKATSVLEKTVAKMSPEGRAAALALDLGPEIEPWWRPRSMRSRPPIPVRPDRGSALHSGPLADVAQLVEHYLAKVKVAGSSLVVRSTTHPKSHHGSRHPTGFRGGSFSFGGSTGATRPHAPWRRRVCGCVVPTECGRSHDAG